MWLVLFSYITVVSGECYSESQNHYLYYGNKTPYDSVRGDIRNVTKLEGCQPLSIWFMGRHGTRFPFQGDWEALKETASMKDQLIQSYMAGHGTMCEEDIKMLSNWIWNKTLEKRSSALTIEGFNELRSFGMRFGEKFAEFMENLDQYIVQTTKEQRTYMSARAFVKGVRRTSNLHLKLKKQMNDDMVIRPYRYCRQRLESFNDHRMLEEIEKFKQTDEFQKMVQRVEHRTGLNLTADTVEGLYNLCRYLRSLTPDHTSPWCAVFRNDDLEIMEYVDDIRFYFLNGNGTPMNRILGAASLKDLYQKFSSAHNGSSTFTAYFSHAAMLDMIYTALGMFSSPITGQQRDHDRVWRKSFITPWGGSLLVVLNRCDDNAGYMVQFFANEIEIFPCGDKICDWEHFTKKFEKYLDTKIDFC